ncbi:16S rRNA (guanine(966)-N(2))-methyltransferase RsmD [Thalassobaculum fulvum]|uniref:16S rRNA (guanine(966)-N(2))-methyltransferase RsmD n=1 Tax=Thalassobaculum fulvum TaxID=1633335 RepID=UPI0016768FB2|nr:16S rRNA (guanine(966)-N(2))-methyltransferase RsmD [Thalassobaculum fulvum]
MRIVAGKHRGAKLTAPEGLEVRPTSERAREALFNILEGGRFGLTLRGARVLDLFAGSGALGLEALSRGAAQVVFVENAPTALAALRANIAKLRAAGLTHIRETDATRFLERSPMPADLVLMDPPYGSGLWAESLDTITRGGWVGPETVVAVEVGKKEKVAAPTGYALVDDRRYGAARLILLQKAPAEG